MIENQGLSVDEVVARLKLAGLIVCLPADLPLQRTLVVADALLASPVLAVEVEMVGVDTAVIQDIHKRANGKMTVGAKVETEAQAKTALQAGAHFISSEQWDTAVWHLCREQASLYIPGSMSVATVEGTWKRGCDAVRVRTGGSDGPAYAATVCELFAEMLITVAADITLENVAEYGRAGADAVFIDQAIYQHDMQTMADIISKARQMQKAWESYEN